MTANAQIKATREEWLSAAQDLLVSHGVEGVKVLALSHRLGVSRSSFYWYYKDRDDLLAELLDDWENQNTATIEEYCARAEKTITGALCNFFRCFVNPRLFNQGLDFAVRAWAKQDTAVRGRIDAADSRRLTAVEGMFLRHGYSAQDADIRARILYFQQLGYHALDQVEDMDERLARVAGYLKGFTGVEPRPEELEAFFAFARKGAA